MGAVAARQGWARQYPPLVVLGGALVLAIFTLPSALILPQASPTQTLEYAPVPPNGSSPPGGDYSGLGLGTSSTLGAAGVGGLPGLLGGTGGNPTTKSCVGHPPRQTEDPASPPCVPYFNGDNGGSTWGGVSRTEVRILIYLDGGYTFSGGSTNNSAPTSTYVDLANPPQPNEYLMIPLARMWMHYFNQRYQTYGRFVHFFMYFNNGQSTPEQRRADAAENYRTIHPFAVLDDAVLGSADEYARAMAAYHVVLFGIDDFSSSLTRTATEDQAFYKSNPGLIWTYSPSIEVQARLVSSFICARIKGHPVSFSGDPTFQGRQRKFGFLTSTDPTFPFNTELADQVKSQVQGCGIQITDDLTYPTTHEANPQQDAQDMATMKKDGITTILWPGGYETGENAAASSVAYYPEWVLGTDFALNNYGGLMDPSQAKDSMVVSSVTLQNANGVPVEPSCLEALLSVDPQLDTNSRDPVYACWLYPDLRQLFSAVQVAGPHLDPSQIDQGFHAIPASSSAGPAAPACYYEPGDYTCLKDAVWEWWDPSAQTSPAAREGESSLGSGCWRMGDGGDRHAAGAWPSTDPGTQRLSSNPCNLA